MSKLIKTKALRNGNNSPAAVATSSHLDYCNYMYNRVSKEMTYKQIFLELIGIIPMLLSTIIALFTRLTHGIILYPVWFFVHILKKKKYIAEYGVDKLNEGAKTLK